MNDYFNIYIDRLKKGGQEELERSFSPDFLGVTDKETLFPEEVKVKGEAYIANEDLVLHLDASTKVMIPCSICNEMVPISLVSKGIYHVIPLLEIRGGVYNIQEIIRENIVIELPSFAECHDGNCPSRAELEKFLHQKTECSDDVEEGHQPFNSALKNFRPHPRREDS